ASAAAVDPPEAHQPAVLRLAFMQPAFEQPAFEQPAYPGHHRTGPAGTSVPGRAGGYSVHSSRSGGSSSSISGKRPTASWKRLSVLSSLHCDTSPIRTGP